MEIAFDAQGNGVVVARPVGRLDLISAAATKTRLSETAAGGHPRIVIDLAGVSFIDSTGLGALIGALKAARQHGGDLRLARPTDQAKLLLSLTALDRVMKPYASVDEALAGY